MNHEDRTQSPDLNSPVDGYLIYCEVEGKDGLFNKWCQVQQISKLGGRSEA